MEQIWRQQVEIVGRQRYITQPVLDNEAVLNRLLVKGANPSAPEPHRRCTPLHLAAGRGHNERAVRLLLENGADIMARDDSENTPLHLAGKSGTEAVARLLIEKGSVVSAVAVESGNTPLRLAEARGHDAVVKLLKEGAYT